MCLYYICYEVVWTYKSAGWSWVKPIFSHLPWKFSQTANCHRLLEMVSFIYVLHIPINNSSIPSYSISVYQYIYIYLIYQYIAPIWSGFSVDFPSSKVEFRGAKHGIHNDSAAPKIARTVVLASLPRVFFRYDKVSCGDPMPPVRMLFLLDPSAVTLRGCRMWCRNACNRCPKIFPSDSKISMHMIQFSGMEFLVLAWKWANPLVIIIRINVGNLVKTYHLGWCAESIYGYLQWFWGWFINLIIIVIINDFLVCHMILLKIGHLEG